MICSSSKHLLLEIIEIIDINTAFLIYKITFSFWFLLNFLSLEIQRDGDVDANKEIEANS